MEDYLYYLNVFLAPALFSNEVLGIDKVVQGRDAIEGEFPYVVSLQWKRVFIQRCGAVLLNPMFLLTACHCVKTFTREGAGKNFDITNLFAIAGSNNRLPGKGGTVRFLDMAVVHPKCYNHGNGEITNDVAIIKLSFPFKWTTRLKPAPFNLENMFQKNRMVTSNCMGVGWGASKVDKGWKVYTNYPHRLQAIDVMVMSDNECSDWLCEQSIYFCKTSSEGRVRSIEVVCGNGADGGDVCTGDSGGPLICNGYIVGVVSWGPACGELKYPTVYQDVHYFFDFFAPLITKTKRPNFKNE